MHIQNGKYYARRALRLGMNICKSKLKIQKIRLNKQYEENRGNGTSHKDDGE